MLYDIDQIRAHYRRFIEEKPSEYYERFDPDLMDKRPLVRDLLEKAFQRLFEEKVGRLLDVGCGTCFYYPLLSKHAETILGIDLCVPMLREAQKLIDGKALRNCEVRESSALELPLDDSTVDVVHSWDFLHHCPDIPKSASEIARVLKPDGRYIAVEPNVVNPSILWYHARRRIEWGLLTRNRFTIPRTLGEHFDVEVSYDNTIISFLNERTWPIWKAFNAITSIPPLHLLSFRYIMKCRPKR